MKIDQMERFLKIKVGFVIEMCVNNIYIVSAH